MQWNIYANMKERTCTAVYRYMRTVKPISNKAPANVPPK
jgi:hypothetical protein